MNDQNYYGFATLNAGTSEYNKLAFIIRRFLNDMATVTLVKVEAVDAPSGVGPVGTVDVRPMVYQVDGVGNTQDHGVIYGVPYFRLQGGANAVIIDPKVGDIGLCAFASRDISSVKANKAPSPPGSARKYSYADGLFFGAFLGDAPANYIMFDANGDIILKPASKVTVMGDLDVSGTMTAGVDVVADGISLHNHTHTGVTTGGGATGGPQ